MEMTMAHDQVDRKPQAGEKAMTSSIRDQLSTLSALQRIEIEIAGFEKSLADVDARIDALNEEVRAFQAQVDESRGHIEDLKKRYRDSEAEVKVIDGRIAQRNDQLRAVKTNKEYQTMLKEIDDLRAKRSELEDKTLVVLDDSEKTEAQIAILKRDLIDLTQEIEEKQKVIHKTAEAERQNLERLVGERDAIMATLTPDLHKLFAKAKKQGRGIAVAAVIDAVCQVCRMNIPPQMYNELMRLDTLRTCPNCQRIIYPKALVEED
jgi:uncharacterized protein